MCDVPTRQPAQPTRIARRVWSRLTAATVAVLAGGLSTAYAAEVVVRVEGVTPSQTRVYVSLCTGGLEPDDCGNAQVVGADSPTLQVRFANVPPGVYAVAAFQDLNGDGTLDRSPRGLPREPYGFSREAGRMTSPRFDRAAFTVERDVSVAVRLALPGRP
ncbi:DUF2141 domain-containing protein [Lichenihabitans psoromatis]|uniref:DUF2141 domain-containing protein n=1 Tax=Lichenihabitans psoromatis TaxID=2528642 RepID=UPI001035BF1B|nr:DUF2141 domain-containing protein [Lichenihabitans psoromatis]